MTLALTKAEYDKYPLSRFLDIDCFEKIIPFWNNKSIDLYLLFIEIYIEMDIIRNNRLIILE